MTKSILLVLALLPACAVDDSAPPATSQSSHALLGDEPICYDAFGDPVYDDGFGDDGFALEQCDSFDDPFGGGFGGDTSGWCSGPTTYQGSGEATATHATAQEMSMVRATSAAQLECTESGLVCYPHASAGTLITASCSWLGFDQWSCTATEQVTCTYTRSP
jgi:hypothetical protein